MEGKDEYRDSFGPIYGSTPEPAWVEPKIPWARIWARVVTRLLAWIVGPLLAAPVAYLVVKGETNAVGLLVASLPLSVFGAFLAFGRGHKAVGWLARLIAIAGLLLIAFFGLIGWALYQAESP